MDESCVNIHGWSTWAGTLQKCTKIYSIGEKQPFQGDNCSVHCAIFVKGWLSKQPVKNDGRRTQIQTQLGKIRIT